MAILMWPPSDGSQNTITVNGRVYSASPGNSTAVSYIDVNILESNRWTTYQTSAGQVAVPIQTPVGVPTERFSVNGRVYVFPPGSTVNVASFDYPILEANGFISMAASASGGVFQLIPRFLRSRARRRLGRLSRHRQDLGRARQRVSLINGRATARIFPVRSHHRMFRLLVISAIPLQCLSLQRTPRALARLPPAPRQARSSRQAAASLSTAWLPRSPAPRKLAAPSRRATAPGRIHPPISPTSGTAAA